MITQKLQEFEEEVKATGDILTQATIDIYTSIVQTMLPTPTKIHYLFNLRDISKVCVTLLCVVRSGVVNFLAQLHLAFVLDVV